MHKHSLALEFFWHPYRSIRSRFAPPSEAQFRRKPSPCHTCVNRLRFSSITGVCPTSMPGMRPISFLPRALMLLATGCSSSTFGDGAVWASRRRPSARRSSSKTRRRAFFSTVVT